MGKSRIHIDFRMKYDKVGLGAMTLVTGRRIKILNLKWIMNIL